MAMNKFYLILVLIVLSSCKRGNTHDSTANASFIDFSFLDNSGIKIDSTLFSNSKDEKIKSFYRKYHFETVWNSKNQRDFIIKEIQNAEDEGLQAKDYNYHTLKSFEEKFDHLPDSIVIQYDILLTKSAQKYISHISKGKLNPKELYVKYAGLF